MPIHLGKDSKGPFVQWGHQKKYYYKVGNKKSLENAKSKANKQMKAIFSNGYMEQIKNMKSKFNMLYQSIIKAPFNSNKIDQQYFNDLNLYQYEQPIEISDQDFIQIFKDNEGFYFAYILNEFNEVKYFIDDRFQTKEECIVNAKNLINNNKKERIEDEEI